MKRPQPSLFIGSGVDLANKPSAPESHPPNLWKRVLLDGVGHDAREEEPETVSRMLLEFMAV